ncbi:MAG: thiamine diphosphokinase [Actinomycetes bacterium]
MSSAVVFSGGPHPLVVDLDGLRASDVSRSSLSEVNSEVARAVGQLNPQFVVAADSGLHLALSCGLIPDLVIGDMDSVDPALLDQALQGGAEVRSFPTDKEATDLELALEALRGLSVGDLSAVTVIGSGAGRLDHLFAGVMLLASQRFADLQIDAWFGDTYLAVVRGSASVTGAPGQILSVLAVHGPAVGVRSTGLRWAFCGEDLEPGSSRGVSNEFVEAVAHLSVDQGCVAVITNPQRQS